MKRLKLSHYLFIIGTLLVIVISGIIAYQQLTPKYYNYSGNQYKPGESFLDKEGCNLCFFDKDGQMQCTLKACYDDEPPTNGFNDLIKINFKYSENSYKYSGVITKSTPCIIIKTETIIHESFPETVNLKFTLEGNGGMCVDVIDEENIQGTIPVSIDASIQVYVNDNLINGVGVNTN